MSQAKTLNAQELEKVLSYINTRKYSARDRAMLLVSHLSGMRVGEIASLTVGHVLDMNDEVRNEIRLTAGQTKGKHPRTVFISSKLRNELAIYVQTIRKDDKNRALFPTQKNPSKGFSANTLTQHFLSLYKSAGIDGASSHSGRRTFATQISQKGVSVRVLMKCLGHRNISTTMAYIDANDDMLRNAVELL